MKDFGDSNLDLVFVLKHLKEKSRGISSWVGGWRVGEGCVVRYSGLVGNKS